ncbi:MAG: ASKHA domain-containing protein [Candidatus Helarchaeota archaeon]
MPEFVVTFQPEGKRVKVKDDQTILDAARIAGIDLISVCGGAGTCGKCKVILKESSSISEISNKERDLLSKEEINSGIRLACQTKIRNHVVIRVPEYSRTGKQRLQIEGIETSIKADPTVRKIYLELSEPTLDDLRSDVDRINEGIRTRLKTNNLKIGLEVLNDLSEITRNCEWKFTVVLWNGEIISLEPGDTRRHLFGYAVDIGTTKLAGYLVDLNSAKVIAAGSLLNPQIPYGEDVISRLNHPERNMLHEIVIQGINYILDDLMEKTGILREEIYEMVGVGNTVMHHLFLNLNPKYLGRAPYPPVIRNSLAIDSGQVGINIHPQGKIFFLPVIAGFVGADTVSVILASEIYKRKEISLALDIGTNTEVVLGNQDKMLTCSCASGPAFEGAHIKHGMRAASGAIEKISIDPETRKISFSTIDGDPPIGICGSGMIDILAEMLIAGIVDVKGRFNKAYNSPRVRIGQDGIELVVVPAEESGTQKDITFSQKDVRQILLAKAAMNTGITILMKHFNLTKDDIKKLFIAGAFGSHINEKSARTIGLLPEVDLNIVEPIGNAAGTGARMCLVSREAKTIVESISERVTYVELATDPDFQSAFLNANFLPNSRLEDYPETSQLLKRYGNFPERLPPRF